MALIHEQKMLLLLLLQLIPVPHWLLLHCARPSVLLRRSRFRLALGDFAVCYLGIEFVSPCAGVHM